MEKQASTVDTMKPAQEKSDNDVKKLLVVQYGHASDDELSYPSFFTVDFYNYYTLPQ